MMITKQKDNKNKNSKNNNHQNKNNKNKNSRNNFKHYYFLLLMLIITLAVIANAERLPTIGGDEGSWGTVLNSFLSRQHAPDGTHGNVTADSLNVTGEVKI